MRKTPLLFALVLVLAACSGSDSDSSSAETQVDLQIRVEDCQEVPSDVLEAIETGLTLEGASLPLGFAIETPSFPGIFWIAAELDGPGYEDAGDTPVWVAESIDFGEITVDLGFWSVNPLAMSVSSWGDGSTREFSTFGEGIRAASACVLVDAGILDERELGG